MDIRLKRKYTVYGDRVIKRKCPIGNGNGKRPRPFARPSDRVTGTNPKPKTMLVNGLTGHAVMVAL